MRHLAENGAQECALARAVGTDDRRQLAAVDMQIDMRKDFKRPERDAEVFDFGAAKIRAARRRTSLMKKALHGYSLLEFSP